MYRLGWDFCILAVIGRWLTGCSGGCLLRFHLLTVHLGFLSAVGNVIATANDHLTYLTWTAPPSLDDISGYCVDIRSNSFTIFSECGITETEFNYTLPSYSACNNYMFTLTPVNDLGNGTRFTGSYSGTKPSKINTCTGHLSA